MTNVSAPKSAMIMVAKPPAGPRVKSTTRTPFSTSDIPLNSPYLCNSSDLCQLNRLVKSGCSNPQNTVELATLSVLADADI
jgi:hypothetical protein